MIYLAVVGGSSCTEQEMELARETGKEIAGRGAVLLCGGGSGVMEAASAGASQEGGMVIGILPGGSAREGNQYLTAAIATGMGEARNAIITRTADAVIAIGGEYGTLSEIALAIKMGKPVIGLRSWRLSPPHGVKDGIIEKAGAEEAVETAFCLINY